MKKDCTLEWLAKSPELNIVENCWGSLEDNSQILMNLKYEYRGKMGETKLKAIVLRLLSLNLHKTIVSDNEQSSDNGSVSNRPKCKKTIYQKLWIM
ncbi:uncharacterized protein LOC122529411 isoform X2 [Frieseomelitta varia]|uniref:uncharacterized protein LOC122529411 isoform X2 n=1 Tax=Frieseomelitta varia TaxID=561572 RepID=UPI001CB690F7|nr:uncharacterized protein LOC122529411 isoform X2 [Frieseomelitta varia]